MPRCANLALALLLFTFAVSASPSSARASDGYEVALPIAGGLIGTVALDVTFTVATGLTYHDDTWATLEVIWGSLSLVGSGIGVGVAIDQGIDGLAGALVLQGIGSAIHLAYGLIGLETDEESPYVQVALVPTSGGFSLSACGAF